MNKEDIQELMDYNLEYMEAQQSEEIFGGDYTSAVDLKYANKQIEKLEKTLKEKCDLIDKAIEKLYCWGEALDAQFQQEMLRILRGENNEQSKNDD